MAFFQDTARQPFLRVPAIVVWLIAIFIGIQIAMTTVLASRANEIYDAYGFVPAHVLASHRIQLGIAPGGFIGKAVPFFTYLFLHGSWSHAIINSVWLLAFGPVVARRFGTFFFLCFFFLCGLGGAGAHLAAFWGSPAPVIGASGAISGLMGAGFRMLPFGEREGTRQQLAPLLSTRIVVWSLIWLFVNVIAGVTGLGSGGEVNVVAWEAHMGGYFVGLLLAGPFDALARREHTEIEDHP